MHIDADGAARMVDILLSTLERGQACPPAERALWLRRVFLAILDEEEGRLTADPTLIAQLRAEVLAQG